MAAARAEPVDLELVLAADGSGSIDDEELGLQRAGYGAAITHPRVLDAIRAGYRGAIAVTYVEWGAPDSQHIIVDWTRIDGAGSARAFADALLAAPRRAFGYNSISNALHYAAAEIRTNDYQGSRAVIDLSGDGPQIGGRPIGSVRAGIVTAGITINALVIKSPGGGFRGPGGIPLDEHYRRDVVGGFGAFVMVAEDRSHFAEAILKKLILEIAGAGTGSGHASASRGTD